MAPAVYGTPEELLLVIGVGFGGEGEDGKENVLPFSDVGVRIIIHLHSPVL